MIVGSLRAEAAYADQLLDLDLELPDLRTTLRLGFDPLLRSFSLSGEIDDLILDQLVAMESEPFGGVLGLAMEVRGNLDEPESWSGSLDLRKLELEARGTSLELGQPARVTFDGSQLATQDLELTAGNTTRLRIGGQLTTAVPGNLGLELTADLADLAPWVTLVLPAAVVEAGALQARGSLRVIVNSSGTLQDSTVSGELSVTGGEIQWGDFEALSVELQAEVREQTLQLRSASIGWNGAMVSATGELPLAWLGEWLPAALAAKTVPGAAILEARIDGANEQLLEPLLSPGALSDAAGAFVASTRLRADEPATASISGDLLLESAELLVSGTALRQRQPTRFAIDNGAVSVDNWPWTGPNTEVGISGLMELARDPRLDLQLRGGIEMRLLNALGLAAAFGGHSTLVVDVRGTASAPVITGEATLVDGLVRNAEPQIVATEIAATVEFSGDRARASNITATINGGTARMDFELDYKNLSTPTVAATLMGRGIPVRLAGGLQTEIDLDLSLSTEPTRAPVLAGSILLRRGSYRETVSLGQQLRNYLATSTTLALEPGPLDELRYDIRLQTADNIRVDTNYARLPLAFDLRLVGNFAQPGLTGRATLRQGGQILLNNVSYRIERGSIDFTNPRQIEPNLDITGLTRVSERTITLQLSGTLNQLDADLSSEPSLGQSDIISVLLTGRELGTPGSTRTEVLRDQAISFLAGEYLTSAGRAVGLDTLQLERSSNTPDEVRSDHMEIAFEANPRSRLTFGKSISRQVELIFSRDLSESAATTWILGYRWRPNLELKGLLEDNNDRVLELRHEILFGGGPSPSATDSGATRELITRRVGTIRFVGSPGVSVAELSARLDLEPGDRFDFFRWQQDRERLESWYHQRGYLEVRISTRREGTETSTDEPSLLRPIVDLLYDIKRGPRTLLTIDGTVSGRLRRLMEAAWSSSVFDELLVEELASLLRQELAERSYLRSEIEGNVGIDRDASGERRKEILFEGDIQLPKAKMLALLGLSEGAAFDPATVERGRQRVQQNYRDRGYNNGFVLLTPNVDRLTASVSISLSTQMGRQQILQEIAVDGIGRARRSFIDRTLDLEPGRPLDLEALYRARKRLYDTGVFQDVDVRVESLAVVDSLVDDGFTTETESVRARFTVREWPRFRLRYGARANNELDPLAEPLVESRRWLLGLSADLTYQNFLGRGASLGLSARATREFRVGRVFVSTPRFFGLPLRTSLFVSRSRQEIGGGNFDLFIRNVTSMTGEQRLSLRPNLSVAYSYSFERNETFDPDFDPDDPFAIRGDPIDIARLTLTTVYDTRDDLVSPTGGWFHSSTFEYAVPAIGSHLQFTKYLLQQFYFRPVGPFVLASALRFGTGAGFGSDLIPSERFAAGGRNTVRGYPEASLGDLRDFFGRPQGGNALLLVNQELRFPIWRSFQGVTFLDAGHAFARLGDLSVANLKVGTGLGLRLATSVVLLRLDYGIRLNAFVDEPRGRFHFSIGHAF